MIKNTCLVLSFLASPMVNASPWSSWGSYFTSFFWRQSYNQTRSGNASASATSLNNNKLGNTSYLWTFGLGLGAIAGCYHYRVWKQHKEATGRTRNLAHAICKNNEHGIAYWLGRTNVSNINNEDYVNRFDHGFIKSIFSKLDFTRMTPLEASIYQKKKDLTQQLLTLKADPNTVCRGVNLQYALHKDPELLKLLLKHGLDPNKEYNGLRLDPIKQDSLQRNLSIGVNIPLIVPALLNNNKKDVLALLHHGAKLDENDTYCFSDYHTEESFSVNQKKLLRDASAQVKRENIAPLSKITQTKNNGEHASLSVFPDGVAQNIATFLTLRETACVASVCKAPAKKVLRYGTQLASAVE